MSGTVLRAAAACGTALAAGWIATAMWARWRCREHRVVVVKLGGSAVTDKGGFEAAREDVIAKVAAAIKDAVALHAPRGIKVIVVHGAGSFGHPQAKKYGVSRGRSLAADGELRAGAALTRASVTKLNAVVLAALLEQGVAAVTVSPFPEARCAGRDRRRDAADVAARQAIRVAGAGLVPVVHGDVILTEDGGCTVLSGDTIIERIAYQCGGGCRRVVFLTDVPGVLSMPPGNPGAKVVPEILVPPRGDPKLADVFDSTSTGGAGAKKAVADVTGGIMGKVRSAVAAARSGAAEVWIVGTAQAPAALGDLRARPAVGTRIAVGGGGL